MVDYKAMLTKYFEVVSNAEGVYFLYESEWTPEEWVAILEILPHLKEKKFRSVV